MVNKRRYDEGQSMPPPLDESWWEAVLAEDEAQSISRAERSERLTSSLHQKEPLQALETAPVTLDWQKAIQLYEEDQVIVLHVTGWNRGGLLVNGHGLQGFVPISHLVEAPCPDVNIEDWLGKYVDTTLKLKVIECDQERGRVVFSERAALSEPGRRKQLLTSLVPGMCTSGVVTNVTDFGIFVDLGGIEGLIHVSEISWGRVQHPSDMVSLGQVIKVYVVQVDRERARVALSLKRLNPNPWATAAERYYPGQITEAIVTSIVPFGAFARLEEGLDGLIHISEMCDGDNPARPEDFLHEGQLVRVRVLHVDAAKQRLGLSLRLSGEDLLIRQA